MATVLSTGRAAQLDANRARSLISRRIDRYALVTNRRLIEGDHWLDGDGWIGPRPIMGTDTWHLEMRLLEQGFVSKNVMLEVVERHAMGVIGREPGWSLVERAPKPDAEPDAATAALIAEATAALVEWWDDEKSGALAALQEAARMIQWAASADRKGRAVVRLYLPSGAGQRTQQGGVRFSASSLAESLKLIRVEAVQPDQAAVYEWEDTQERAGLYSYEVELANGERVRRVEIVGVEGEDTVIRQLEDGGVTRSATVRIGGRLTMIEVERPLVITEQVRRQQYALNLAISTVPRTVVTAGFLERIYLNAAPPGHWERDASGNPVRFVPDEWAVGPGTTQWLEGSEIEDPTTGRRTRGTPSVQFREPVPPTSSAEAKELHYRDILDEVDQSHVALNSEAAPSGRSREQARADYLASLRQTQAPIERIGRWMLETALALASAIINQPGRFDALRASFQCRLDQGPIAGDEQERAITGVEKGLIPRQEGMRRLGIDDTDAAITEIEADLNVAIERLRSQAEVFTTFANVVDAATAAELAGLDEEQVELIRRGLVLPPTDGPPAVDPIDDGGDDDGDDGDDGDEEGGEDGGE